jgi:hypothetical protein
MLRPVAAGWAGSLAGALMQLFPGPGWALWLLSCGDKMLFYMTVLASLVVICWNLMSPDLEAREERAAREEERQEELLRLRAGNAAAWQGASAAAFRQNMTALQAAFLAGTVSVNGTGLRPEEAMAVIDGGCLKYAGPPPVFTPPGGIRFILPPGAVHPAQAAPAQELMPPPGSTFIPCSTSLERVTGVTAGGARERHVKSACDGCGVPLDVAWCAPGVPYLCIPCRY